MAARLFGCGRNCRQWLSLDGLSRWSLLVVNQSASLLTRFGQAVLKMILVTESGLWLDRFAE